MEKQVRGKKVWSLKPLSHPRLFSLVNDHLSPPHSFHKDLQDKWRANYHEMIWVPLECQVVLVWGMCIYNLSNTIQDHRVNSGGTDIEVRRGPCFPANYLPEHRKQISCMCESGQKGQDRKSKQIRTFALKKIFWLTNVKPDFQKFTSSSHTRNRHFHSTLKWLHVLLSLAQHSHLPTIPVTPLNIYLNK